MILRRFLLLLLKLRVNNRFAKNASTLDEAPMAYKPIAEILENIKDTVDVVKQIKPVYNIKAEE
ncbi:MAG: RtcB family protein [Eubacteriales bacterium]|nr:RtcB family protein [Eubacteriales bacterium]